MATTETGSKSPSISFGTGPAGIPTKQRKYACNLHIRAIDNGFVLSVDKDTPEGYQNVELAITSLPKLLKAICTFLKADSKEAA